MLLIEQGARGRLSGGERALCPRSRRRATLWPPRSAWAARHGVSAPRWPLFGAGGREGLCALRGSSRGQAPWRTRSLPSPDSLHAACGAPRLPPSGAVELSTAEHTGRLRLRPLAHHSPDAPAISLAPPSLKPPLATQPSPASQPVHQRNDHERGRQRAGARAPPAAPSGHGSALQGRTQARWSLVMRQSGVDVGRA